MDHKEFRRTQDVIGVKGYELAELLGTTEKTVSHYRNNRTPIPGPVAVAMQALASGWRPEEK